MSQPSKPVHLEGQGEEKGSDLEAPPKPSQAEGERTAFPAGEEDTTGNPLVEAETPPKPSQAEGEAETA